MFTKNVSLCKRPSMTEARRTQIMTTSFNWILDMPSDVRISGACLCQLSSRWDECNA